MNYNDINHQCAEAMGWKEGATIAEVTYWFPTTSSRGIQLPAFCTDWNAMRTLVEYAENKICPFELCVEHGESVANFGYTAFIQANTVPLATALAFLKCFGKEENDGCTK
jgi:hypothetical protein